MDDSDQLGPNTAIHNDPRFIVATTLATLLLAGSAFVWRSGPRNILATQLGEIAHRVPDSSVTTDHELLGSESKTAGSSKGAHASTAIASRDDLGDDGEAKDSKRSKERRRRGKDPLKDLLKNPKKGKLLVKSGILDDSRRGMLPKIDEVTRHSRGLSQATSSRSLSSNSNHRSPLRSLERASPYPGSNQGSHTGDGDDENENEDETLAAISSTSSNPDPPSSPAQPDLDPSSSTSSLLASDTPKSLRNPVSPNFPPSSSSSASQSHTNSTASSDFVITPNTSPTLSQSGKTPTVPQTDAEAPYNKAIATSISTPIVRKSQSPGPWDWDGTSQNPAPTSNVTPHRKGSRFRSTSRGPDSITATRPSAIPVSISQLDTYSSDAQSSSSRFNSPTTNTVPLSATLDTQEDLGHAFSFPSLNASAAPSLSSPVSPRPSRGTNGTHLNGNGHANGSSSTPRRAPTPRRPPTPLSGTSTPPPSLSVQTQLASLRGALEAARLREEKFKVDLERCTKELEMMRWESSTWRRREAELQTQLHLYMNQAQSYGALLASMSGQASPHPQHHMSPGGNAPNGTGAPNGHLPNGYQFSPPTSNPHSPPPHLQIPSAQAQMLLGSSGMLPSPTILPPMSIAHAQSPHSPFYSPYSATSPHPNNLYSMLFPHPATTGTGVGASSGSGPSSVAGSSSVGSHSPDLAGGTASSGTPPPPTPSSLDRGRRRTRTAGARLPGERAWEEGSDGWVGEEGAVEGGDGVYSEGEDDDEGGLNEVLADAILKRPGSIRALSRKGKGKDRDRGEKDKDSPPTEFTFPSLSDFGNVNRVFSPPQEELEEQPPATERMDEPEEKGPGGPPVTVDEERKDDPHPATAEYSEGTTVDIQQEIPS